MIADRDPREVLRHLVRWASHRDSVRAVLLTSSRAKPGAPVDALSDYDVLLVVEDIRPFFEDRSWLGDFGEVLVAYWGPIYADPDHGVERTGNVVQYADGLHIDFRLWPPALARRVADAPGLPAELDDGYAVLLDKDVLFDAMASPGHSAYIPERPDEGTYLTLVNDFFSNVPYVAKCLRRDELLPVKWCLDYDMKYVYLIPMLEWRMERDRDWSEPTGGRGRGLKGRLPPEIWEELEDTYAGAGIAENWEALFRTMALFRRVAEEVADDLGYAYPLDLDRRVTEYARAVKHPGQGSGL